MALLPIGTKVFGFLCHPFRVTEGKIIEYSEYPPHVKNPPTRYQCEMYDPHRDVTMVEAFYWVYLSREEAIDAHAAVRKIFYKPLK